jgi:protein TonB
VAASAGPSIGVAGGTGADSDGGGNGSGHSSGSGIGDGSDQRAACVYCPEPRYPFIARARGWQGSVDVGLVVLADGSVDGASLRRSSGHGVLDDAAIAVARQSRFRPPAAQGLHVPLRGRIEYRFELSKAR